MLNEGLVYFRIAYLYLCSALLSLNLQKILLRFAQYLVDFSQRFRIYNCVLQPPENLQFLIGKEETAIEARNASNIGTDIGIDSGK